MKNLRFASLMRCLAWVSFFLAGSAGAAGWNYGAAQELRNKDCLFGEDQTLVRTFAGYFGDGATPKVGEVYYVSAIATVAGFPCEGGADVVPEVLLPPQTVLAISSQNPVLCVYMDLTTGEITELSGAECSKAPSQGRYGYAFSPPSGSSFWVPYAYRFEIWVPVVSKKTLSGSSTDSFTAVLRIASDVSGELAPKVGVIVHPNPPAITYPVPSTTSLGNDAASTRGFLANHYTQGNVYADFGKTTAYELSGLGPFSIGEHNAYQMDLNWADLSPGTTYHWRLRFVSSTGATTLGADQTFTTTRTQLPPSGGDGGTEAPDGGPRPPPPPPPPQEGGGCSAAGFGSGAIIVLAGLLRRRRKIRA